MKNMLMMIVAIVRQSMRSADSIRDAEIAVDARLLAMSKAQDLLIKENWKSATLASVIRCATEQHDDTAKRIILQGPAIDVVPPLILPLTLILNELCTNATKYGALSSDRGHVSLSWEVEGDGNSLAIGWVEVGGPPVAPPQKSSFGTRLIEDVIPRQLGGSGRLSFPPSGIEFKLVVPLGSEGSLSVGATRSQRPGHSP
jgi:two-component sensor histidine kinase